MKAILYIVIPCYNEEDVLPEMVPVFQDTLRRLIKDGLVSEDSSILFVNDGSKDSTWERIKEYSKTNSEIRGISLSRNMGHQNALLAGLFEAGKNADIIISIDCDGQDDPLAMREMVKAYYNGSDIVYGVRSNRKSDSFFKRTSAQAYYKLLNAMGARTVYNHADYRLISSKVLKAFSDFKEVNLYLRGLFPLVGFNSSCVYYERHERVAGKSHYPLRKMLSLAWNGITSLSIKPIKLITALGLCISFLSFLLIIWVFISYFTGRSVPGWSSSVLATALIGGIQLISLGVIGEYIGKIYLETKRRPRYIISERTEENKTAAKHENKDQDGDKALKL